MNTNAIGATLVLCGALLTACGGGDGGGTTPLTAPSGLSYASPQSFLRGQPIAPLDPTVTGSVSAYSVTPALPVGLELNTTSGRISGTPSVATVAATYTIAAQNSAGSRRFALSIAVLPPAPIVTVAVSPTKLSLGQSATVTWSSSDATTCTASNAWSGSRATAGTASVTPTASGQLSFSLACTGAGGSANQAALLIVPIPVLRSSYENKMASIAALGPQVLPNFGDVIGYADFFQDGSYSMIYNTIDYIHETPPSDTLFGHIKIYRKINGTWVDRTSSILDKTVGCLHPRKMVIADFNGDRKPDVFLACHGFDGRPFPGEQQHLLLSSAGGSYQNITIPVTCYCHGASAADMDGTGFANIVAVDQNVSGIPFFLMNNGNGTFTRDDTRLPTPLPIKKEIYTVELIDFDRSGRYSVFLAGNDIRPNGFGFQINPTIFPNDGTDHFTSGTPRIIPIASSAVIAAGGGMVLDIVFDAGTIYLLRSTHATFNDMSVQKTNYATLASSEIYSHVGPYQLVGTTDPTPHSAFAWLGIFQDRIVPFSTIWPVSIAK